LVSVLRREVIVPDWFDALRTNIESAGYETRQLSTGHGDLLVTVHAARVLACRLPGATGNFFYHDPKLDQRGQCVQIGGGDRLWLAPEVAFFWPSLELARQDPFKYAATPPQIDPGDYRLASSSDDHVALTASMQVRDHRVDKSIELHVDRQVHCVDPPAGLPASLKCASFAITNRLMVEGGDDGALAGAWDLLQLPPTGTLICPTTTATQPMSYYDPFGEKHVQVDATRVRFLIDAKRRIKMGLPPMNVTGRMGYYRRGAGENLSSLIVRIFAPLPGEPYVDVPLSAEAGTRFGDDCLQAYNDDGAYGAFGEMEYHDPAVIVGHGPAVRSGSSVTHVLLGPDQAIGEFGRQLLGVAIDPIG
jgi:hypothetical protein